ncbi:hypothetical protein TTHERM_000195999 (macronuclear) [Tetrahymena thermophila SB210]|uniref:Uncharacterized protein n=1 Tax=Tetrahymena thermophila (strain SB210) TaxID=312017 RepID=W7XJF3_TETTS|nr:hypothetical protein TTHERM_000195999 [Tetrahymena thermophila SB210]EWS74109.1 hypothetical protein TTHERM_000195999 [Tetrahymena thermophila SB210]|eukprot:XP_012653364.1 hypothetical protein TTHERM_000195999 [Tetrahymena thermophila SB210]
MRTQKKATQNEETQQEDFICIQKLYSSSTKVSLQTIRKLISEYLGFDLVFDSLVEIMEEMDLNDYLNQDYEVSFIVEIINSTYFQERIPPILGKLPKAIYLKTIECVLYIASLKIIEMPQIQNCIQIFNSSDQEWMVNGMPIDNELIQSILWKINRYINERKLTQWILQNKQDFLIQHKIMLHEFLLLACNSSKKEEMQKLLGTMQQDSYQKLMLLAPSFIQGLPIQNRLNRPQSSSHILHKNSTQQHGQIQQYQTLKINQINQLFIANKNNYVSSTQVLDDPQKKRQQLQLNKIQLISNQDNKTEQKKQKNFKLSTQKPVRIENYKSQIFGYHQLDPKYRANLKKILNLRQGADNNTLKKQKSDEIKFIDSNNLRLQENNSFPRHLENQYVSEKALSQTNTTYNLKSNPENKEESQLLNYLLKSQNYVLHQRPQSALKDPPQNPFGFCYHPEKEQPGVPIYVPSSTSQSQLDTSIVINSKKQKSFLNASNDKNFFTSKRMNQSGRNVAEQILDQELHVWETKLVNKTNKENNKLFVPYGNIKKQSFTINLPFEKKI